MIMTNPHTPGHPGRQTVLLVHGLASARLLLRPLASRLRRKGYDARPWGYPSLRYTIQHHGERLAAELKRLDQDPAVERLHLVGHSMGCIVTRWALRQYRPAKTRRLVMLAPPNHGSHVASALTPYLGWLCHPLKQLSDRDDSFVNQLEGIDQLDENGQLEATGKLKGNGEPEGNRQLQVGVIAAGWDYLVQIPSTRIEGQADHLVIPAMHTGLLFRSEVARQIDTFLRQGHFAPRRDSQVAASA